MIVVVKKNGIVSIGGDRYASSTLLRKMPPDYARNTEKIFTIGDSFLGTDQNEAVSAALQHCFAKRTEIPTFKNEAEIFAEFIDLHRMLKNDYFLDFSSKHSGAFEQLGFNTLIANRFGIFLTSSCHTVLEYSRFYAIGDGCDYALGALEALYDKEKSAEELVRAALEVAAQFEVEAGPPGKIFSMPLLQ